MSNDSLSEPGQTAVDHGSNGAAHDVDDGPLDPSVFFGLFDDLADDDLADDAGADPEPDVEPDAELEPLADLDAETDVPFDTDRESHIQIAIEADSDGEDGDVDGAEPSADLHVDAEAEVDAKEEVEAEDEGTADDQVVSETTPPTAVNWLTTEPEELPTNGKPMVVSSPPLIPTGAGRGGGANGSTGVDPDGPARVLDDAPVTLGVSAEVAEQRLDAVPAPTEPEVEGGGRMAKAVLATIAVGLFGGFIVALFFSLRSPDTALDGSATGGTEVREPAASSVTDDPPTDLAEAIAAGVPPTGELLVEHLGNALPVVLGNRADLTSLRFEPGTTDLDEASAALVAELGGLLGDQPTVPVTATVRTYTESTTAGNLALSNDQAEAVVASLVAAGASPEQVRVRGLGATPLSRAQPVPNFVALTPEFGDRRLDEILAEQSPFAFGVPATTADDVWPLRPDGLLIIGEVAEALSGAPAAQLGAAGYSFFPPSENGIRAEADAATAELIEFLATAYGAEPGQVRTVTPGSAVFVPSPEHGSHVWIQAGPASRGAFDVAAIDPADITFESGSAELDTTGAETVAVLAEVLTAGGATIVVDVRAYDAADDEANMALSEARRDALAQALVTAGVSPPQVRMYASGASSYFRDDQGPTVTITVAP